MAKNGFGDVQQFMLKPVLPEEVPHLEADLQYPAESLLEMRRVRTSAAFVRASTDSARNTTEVVMSCDVAHGTQMLARFASNGTGPGSYDFSVLRQLLERMQWPVRVNTGDQEFRSPRVSVSILGAAWIHSSSRNPHRRVERGVGVTYAA